MIPQFPHFGPLRADGRTAVEAFTDHLPPYSDFNFTSLWSWDVSGEVRISQLNGSLIVRFCDYVTGEPFYSFCGGLDVARTAKELLHHAKREGAAPTLKLIPLDCAASLNPAEYCVYEDVDNFDYVFSLLNLSVYPGKAFERRRQLVRQFCRSHQPTVRVLDLAEARTRGEIEVLLKTWALHKHLTAVNTDREFAAIRRLLTTSQQSSFVAVGVYDNVRLVGFSISEVLGGGYAMCHFEKAETEQAGLCSYLMQQSALRLREHGCQQLNYQQDLGVAGLRYYKTSFRPSDMLRKCCIEKMA